MAIYYTGDLHLGHQLVSELRGFADADDHDFMIEAAWRERVRKDDIVYILGDLTLQNPARVVEIVQSLPGRKRLVLGNHDHGHPMHRDAPEYEPGYRAMFEWTGTFARRRINGIEVLLSHFPYEGDHTEVDRFDQYRLRDQGAWLLHGHTHSDEIESRIGRQLHVGWDAWGRPVSEDELAHDGWIS